MMIPRLPVIPAVNPHGIIDIQHVPPTQAVVQAQILQTKIAVMAKGHV
jgi:hypothetical protein